ncbi:hypothetical protein [Nannocystis pusilla]|uniref:Bacterial surface antigen (D15) domain-containing protein n=1 Tax=Nannocystis pusilla TaxID=889268 RepID=A0ABS7U3A2_9BACT|nr:hypothetical protein [Nannocystis pusilla]MBZ5715013.1 hypothetical protein [Nannocystis pusilla]
MPATRPARVPRRLRGVLALLGLLLACLAWRTADASTRDTRWRTLETDHFYIHYYQGNEYPAEKAAMVLERAHERLSTSLSHSPWLKTHVVYQDHTDAANGLANTSPYPRIVAYVTAPDSMSVLEGYDDWIDILLTHEYTHIIHLDTTHGVPRLVNALLGFGRAGKVWQPNVIQPRWFVEGLASHEETRLTSQGRGRHSQWEMYLRAPIVEHGFIPIDRVSSGANIFPHGSSVYLYGLYLLRYISNRYGEDKLAELNHVYGNQTLPFAINRAVEKVLGVTWEKLWEEFELDTVRRFQGQARAIRARGIREGRRITFTTSAQASGNFVRHPFWSPDDQHIYFFEDDGHSNPGIRRIKATGGSIREGVGVGKQGQTLGIERIVELQDAGSGSFVGVSEDMVFEIWGVHDLRYSWTDLWRWRPPAPGARNVRQNPGDLEQLTFGARARDPHVSPDGRTVVFSRNDSAQARLAFLDLATKQVTDVAPMERIQIVTTPRWSADGKKVAYSAFREGGMRDIYIYDREAQTTVRVTADRFLDSEPSWTPDGKYVLFNSDRDGVFNIYAYEVATARVHQVTNVIGGAFEPVVSHDGTKLVYLGFTAYGYDLWVMKLDPAEFFEPLPVQDGLPQIDDPTPDEAGDRGRPVSLQSKRYRAYKTFFPRTIFPSALSSATTGNFGTEIGAAIGVSDVLDFHTLSINGGYNTAFGRPTGSISYEFSRFLPLFRVLVSRDYVRRGSFQRYVYDVPGDTMPGDAAPPYLQTGYDERITTARAAVSVPVVRHPVHNASASLSYSYTHYANAGTAPAVDPNAPASSLPDLGGLGYVAFGFDYDSRRTTRYAYGNETGRAASLNINLIDPHLGGRFSDVWVSGRYVEMLRMPWRGHQVLGLALEGAASAGTLGRRSPFYIGGTSQQAEVLRNFLFRTPYADYGNLRGYQPFAFPGRYYGVLNVEYRIPLADVEHGLGTLPGFLRRLTLAPFVDLGAAWGAGGEKFTRQALKWGVGATFIASFKLGYGDAIDLVLQYARGLDKETGLNYFRAAVARSF